jgi:hypothetical protein
LFYDRLGEAIANELVDWFNQVDATYRSDLRELNELNYARFEAKLEQRLAELRGELRSEIASLRGELKAEIATLRGGLGADMERGFAKQQRYFVGLLVMTLIPIVLRILNV